MYIKCLFSLFYRLAMSYIIDTMNGNEEVYQQYIKQDFFWEVVGRCPVFLNTYVEEDEAAAITSLCKLATEVMSKRLVFISIPF